MGDKIIKINYEEEMKKSYIDYAMSVIVQRAIPDVRDGLKPVHRRILFGMKELNNTPDKPHKKSARIVGDVLGKYHPHGDSSVYEAMVRMSQDFSMLVPMVDGHGNFGSIDGDGAAAMRYTESRMALIALELLQDLEKNVIDFSPNFDNTLKEPTVLPAKYPNLLINGATGIAVGMATNIPPHNLNETINGVIALLNNPNLTTKALMKHIKGPDFPTGGIIANKDDLLSIYETGNGKIRVRARYEVEDIGYGRKNIVITEIPYTLSGSKTRLIEDMIKLISDRRLDEVAEVRDESSKDGIRIVIEVKKGINIDHLISKLYKITKLEDTFPVNLLAISEKKPVVFSLKGMLEKYLEFLKEFNIRRVQFDLNKNKDRQEILEGLIRAVDLIDLIIEIVRGSKDVATVKKCLTTGEVKGIKFKTKQSEKEAKKINFTERQANAILALQLQKLVGLEMKSLNKEFEEVKKEIIYLELLLADETAFNKMIKEDLNRIKKTYGTKRKTVIDNFEVPVIVENATTEELVYALIDRFNYIKIIDGQSYMRSNGDTLDEYRDIIPVMNTDSICIFTDDGDMHQVKMKDMEMSKIRDRGVPLDNLCDISDKNVVLMTPTTDMKNLLFVTKKGYVKSVEPSEFDTNRKQIKSTKLDDDDNIIAIMIIEDEHKEMLLTSTDGRYLRFNISEVPVQKKTARGVTGMNLNKGSEIAKAELSEETEDKKRRRGAKGSLDNLKLV